MHVPQTSVDIHSSRFEPEAPQPTPRSAAEAAADAERGAMEEVMTLMLKVAAGDRFERLGAIVHEHLLTGGKKLRARMALAAAQALSVRPDRGIGWAAACELLHNASLVHDDLQDRDEYRRGRFCVWVRHGEAQAINAGDLMLMLPYSTVDHIDVEPSTKWQLSRALARRAEETVRGQSLEMTLLASRRWDWASYDQAAIGKTSALMTLPVQGAALLADRSPEEAERLADCFLNLGLLFQMQDDVVDLFGNKGRDKPGADIREGRVGALVVEHLTQRPDDLEWLGPILGKSRAQTTDEDVQAVSEVFSKFALPGVLRRIRAMEQEVLANPVLATEPGILKVAQTLSALALAPIRDQLSEVSDV